jgi:hypothetical protein
MYHASCALYATEGVAQLWYWPEEDVPSLNCSAPLEELHVADGNITTVQGQKRAVTTEAPKVWSSGSITVSLPFSLGAYPTLIKCKLTSPTVAMYLQSLSRSDGCGRTLESYILTMHPSSLSSIRGFNAYFDYYPFHLQDLNTACVDGQGCYAKVSLDAYLGQRRCQVDQGFFPECFTM